ncbi:MAG: arsenate reductase ArsC [Brevinematales bacterium]|nr:arsenate reductase ArsC [Brevinematales bacterium]
MKYNVLFLCIQNAGRSQMAEAFARELGNHIIAPHSAGSNPADEINPIVRQCMEEVGIKILNKKPKGFNDLDVKTFDFVVNMGCGDTCPYYPSKEYINWNIPDPKGKTIEEVREIRDIIKSKIIELINYLENYDKSKSSYKPSFK